MQVQRHLLNDVRVEVVVKDFVTRKHKTVQALLVHKQFLEFYTLVAHALVIWRSIRCFRNA